MKQQLAALLSEGQVAELVENDEVHSREIFGEPLLPAGAGTRRVMRFRFEPVGPIKGTGKPAAAGQIRVWDDDANGYRTITIARAHWVDLGAGKEEISE